MRTNDKALLKAAARYLTTIVVLAGVLRSLALEAFDIPTVSMLPTLQVGDHLFINKLDYGPLLPGTQSRLYNHLPPQRGDVIVFTAPTPDDEGKFRTLIKRVIALPGDLLELQGGHPRINGWTVPSCRVGFYDPAPRPGKRQRRGELFVEFLGSSAYLAAYDLHSLRGQSLGPYRIEPNEVWVQGDNRDDSRDSRAWRTAADGQLGVGVPFNRIKGRARWIWFPPSRFGLDVMGAPQLPADADASLKARIVRCLDNRPLRDATYPPTRSPTQTQSRPSEQKRHRQE